MTKPIISVENLSKAYRLGLKEQIPETLVGAVTGVFKAPFKNWKRLASLDMKDGGEADDILWALKDVSFEVERGEVVGIIGRNGAGKSTLLKILSRITEPTSGCVRLRGRVSSLLEVGTGFHPELTGRDNVYMNGTILGMTKREIDAKFDEIVDFSGVEKFLDTPVKRYSSGMQVRLAFAVAAHLEPEILIIDEVLAVGDAEFQKKCLGKMQDVAKEGRTVLFVSHNMPAVRSLTSRGVLLRSGELVFLGSTSETIETYLCDAIDRSGADCVASLDYFRRDRRHCSDVYIERIWLEGHDSHNGALPRLNTKSDVTICCDIYSSISLDDSCISMGLLRNHEQRVATFFSKDNGFNLALRPGTQSLRLQVCSLPLAPGIYTVDVGINKNAHTQAFDVVLDYPLCEIVIPEVATGEIDWPHRPWGSVHWTETKWQQV